jgi:hypothetical protein
MSEAMAAPKTQAPRLYGLLAEFETVDGLVAACEQVRDAGYRRWDAFAPFPVHGLNDAMGIKHTKLPLVVLASGITGATFALLLQWWMNAHNYKLIISGKPLFGIPAAIPITFELTVLFSALAAFIGMLAFNNLPMFYHPLFRSDRFRRVTSDRFFIAIEAGDPLFDESRTTRLLEQAGAAGLERVEE